MNRHAHPRTGRAAEDRHARREVAAGRRDGDLPALRRTGAVLVGHADAHGVAARLVVREARARVTVRSLSSLSA